MGSGKILISHSCFEVELITYGIAPGAQWLMICRTLALATTISQVALSLSLSTLNRNARSKQCM